MLAAGVGSEWGEDAVRRVLDTLRAGDLVARPDPSKLLVILPNTEASDARMIGERLKKAVPEAALGIAVYQQGDMIGELLERTRAALRTAENP